MWMIKPMVQQNIVYVPYLAEWPMLSWRPSPASTTSWSFNFSSSFFWYFLQNPTTDEDEEMPLVIIVCWFMINQHTHVSKHQKHLPYRSTSTQHRKAQQQVPCWEPAQKIWLTFPGVRLPTVAALWFNGEHCSCLSYSNFWLWEEAQVAELEKKQQLWQEHNSFWLFSDILSFHV